MLSLPASSGLHNMAFQASCLGEIAHSGYGWRLYHQNHGKSFVEMLFPQNGSIRLPLRPFTDPP